MAGINTLSGSFTITQNWSASNNLTGQAYQPIQQSGTITAKYSLANTVGNAVAGGSDEYASYILTINASSLATVNFSSITNIMQQTGVSLARIKAYSIQLLSVANDSVNGTACSSITIGNLGTAIGNNNALELGAGTGLAVNTTQSAGAINTVALNTGGTGYPPSAVFAFNILGAGTGAVAMATTNSTGVVNTVVFVAGGGGSGYSNATGAATSVVGFYQLNNGGVHGHGDPSAGGFITVNATQTNLRICNNDAVNAAAVQISVWGGSS
jgi:hypothetical protein